MDAKIKKQTSLETILSNESAKELNKRIPFETRKCHTGNFVSSTTLNSIYKLCWKCRSTLLRPTKIKSWLFSSQLSTGFNWINVVIRNEKSDISFIVKSIVHEFGCRFCNQWENKWIFQSSIFLFLDLGLWY